MLNATMGVKFLFIHIHERVGARVIFTTSK